MATVPWLGGAVAGRIVCRRLHGATGLPVTAGRTRLGLLNVHVHDLVVGEPAAPAVRVGALDIPLAAVWGRGVVSIRDVAVDLRRGGPDDNVSAWLAMRQRREGTPATANGGRLPSVELQRARLSLRDDRRGVHIQTGDIQARLIAGDSFAVTIKDVNGVWAPAGDDDGPAFGAQVVTLAGALSSRLRPVDDPSLAVVNGFARPLPNLALTGVTGTIGPQRAPLPPATDESPQAARDAAAGGHRSLVVDLRGSYGGARESLWTARGTVDPRGGEGRVDVVAERFTLDRIAEVLPPEVLSPGKTAIDGSLDVSWADEAVRFEGDMRVTGLSLMHPALASAPLEDVTMGLDLRGTFFPRRRRLALDRLEGQLGGLTGRLAGVVELQPGAYTFTNGKKLGFVPKVDLTFEIPRVPCAKALASLPPALIPKLAGFSLQGFFDANLAAKIDYADLDSLTLAGKVGIDGCHVLKAAPAVLPLLTGESIPQTVDVPPPPGRPGNAKVSVGGSTIDTDTMEFIVGPENPDFVPFDQIAPAFINSILTTEDNGFFRHRGWVSSEFRTALKKNLAAGYFHGGASSITMQMVKNVLLSQEKTLSRKLQELFLVWFLEQNLPKQRILELYFNAIEFGPRIYGIGSAARHYFGKKASDLTPLEGAFFSSILPSPKRRYIQYCHGAPFPPWDKYVRRILAKVHERGHLTDEEYQAASAETLVFDRREATFTEKQCLDWVKKMTPARIEPESPGDVETPGDEADGETPAAGGMRAAGKRLLKLFHSHRVGTRPITTATVALPSPLGRPAPHP